MQKVHLEAPRGWINDPNGFIYYKNKYHLFYQHFPYSTMWGRMHWGHATSDDLVNWEHLDIALYPSKYNDMDGCFSGSAIENDGKMYIYYTGVRYLDVDHENTNHTKSDMFVSSQLMVTSEDGYSFDNIKNKSTIVEPIRDKNLGHHIHTRDPKVWRGKNAWYMILGTTVNNIGKLLVYKSNDLTNWEYWKSIEHDGYGCMWECPDYFEINGDGVLIFSSMGLINNEAISICTLADFNEDNGEMSFDSHYQIFDYGKDLYAPQSTTDKDGIRTVIAWARMPEPQNKNAIGVFSVPREIEIIDGHIYFRPHRNIISAFCKSTDIIRENTLIKTTLKDGDTLNIGGYEIAYKNDTIITDRSNVFRGHSQNGYVFNSPKLNGKCDLTIIVSKSIIEIFINDGEYVISNVVYDLEDYFNATAEYKMYTI